MLIELGASFINGIPPAKPQITQFVKFDPAHPYIKFSVLRGVLKILKNQFCPIAPKIFLVGYWVMKGPTGNRISSKSPYLLPFRSYGQKTSFLSENAENGYKRTFFGHNS